MHTTDDKVKKLTVDSPCPLFIILNRAHIFLINIVLIIYYIEVGEDVQIVENTLVQREEAGENDKISILTQVISKQHTVIQRLKSEQ